MEYKCQVVFIRASLIFSPEMSLSVCPQLLQDYSGKVRIKPFSYSGAVRQIVSQIPQVRFTFLLRPYLFIHLTILKYSTSMISFD